MSKIDGLNSVDFSIPLESYSNPEIGDAFLLRCCWQRFANGFRFSIESRELIAEIKKPAHKLLPNISKYPNRNKANDENHKKMIWELQMSVRGWLESQYKLNKATRFKSVEARFENSEAIFDIGKAIKYNQNKF